MLLKLYLRTGLRYGEGVSLYPADFDLRSQQPAVWVRRTWTKKYGYGAPKGGKDRVVPVVPELAAEIDALLCERGLSPKSTTEHPFSADGSRPYEHKHVLTLVKKTGELAGTQPTRTSPAHVGYAVRSALAARPVQLRPRS